MGKGSVNLIGAEVVTSADVEWMRQIRNSCRKFMTRSTAEILEIDQALWWKSIDKKTNQTFLFWISEHNKPIGYGIVRRSEGKCWVSGGLIPEFRGKKLGVQLFEFLKDRAGVPCWLEVLHDNIAGIKTYERLGFQKMFTSGGIITMAVGMVTSKKFLKTLDLEKSKSLIPENGKIIWQEEAKILFKDGLLVPLHSNSIENVQRKTENKMIYPTRILLATINYDHPQNGMLQAFRGIFGGENVYSFDYLERQRQGVLLENINSQFYKNALELNPDWIFLQLQDTNVITAETILKLRIALPNCVISHWTGDARPSISPYLASICEATSLTLVSSTGQLDDYKSAGAQVAKYLQIGVDWEEDVLGIPDWTPPFRVPEVVFIGGYYGNAFPVGSEERVTAIRALQKAGIDVGVVGTGWPTDIPCVGSCHVKQQHHVWKRAKVCLSINHFNNIRGYYSDRQLISMASGTPVVCKYIPGLDKEFINTVHCYWFHDNDELVGIVQELLGDEGRRKVIGTQGRAEIIKNHTWFSRIFQILPTIVEMREESFRVSAPQE